VKLEQRRIRLVSLVVILVLTAIPFNGFRSPQICWVAPLDDVLMNILLYMPFGYGFGDGGAASAIMKGGALSFAIETAQAFYKNRYSQPSDVISNTVGAFLGVVLYGVLRKVTASNQHSLPADDRSGI
jgi:glycopeptide antibiotics resistance protein